MLKKPIDYKVGIQKKKKKKKRKKELSDFEHLKEERRPNCLNYEITVSNNKSREKENKFIRTMSRASKLSNNNNKITVMNEICQEAL